MSEPESRQCKYCGKPLQRKAGESPCGFHKRQFCDRACQHASLVVPTPAKTCQQCGASFERRKNESGPVFEKRTTCSSRCGQKFRTDHAYCAPLPVPQPKPCEGCGRMLAIREGEKPSHFAKLRFCSRSCAAQYRERGNHETHTCHNCGKRFETSKAHSKYHPTKYCSHECAIAGTMRGIPKSPEHNRKNSEALTGRVISAVHRAKLSSAMARRFQDPEERRKTSAATSRGMLHSSVTCKLRRNALKMIEQAAALGRLGSRPEHVLRAELDKRGIAYLHNVSLEGIGVPDLVFPDHRLIVEVDGEYWHSLKENAERDRRKDAAYQSAGYVVLRFWAKGEVLADPSGCADKIINVLNGLTPAKP